MVTLVNPSNEKAIRKLWNIYHIVNLIAICSAVPFWFFTPFLSRDIDNNNWHKFFRGFSIAYGLTASGAVLIISNELTRLKPKIDALNKRETAEFKHGLASDLFLAQGRNTAIAQLLLSDFTSGGGSGAEVAYQDDTTAYEVETSGTSGKAEVGTSITSVSGSRAEMGLSAKAENFFDLVNDALRDGYSDTKIIEDLLGFKGRSYKQGKAILAEIKQFLDLQDD